MSGLTQNRPDALKTCNEAKVQYFLRFWWCNAICFVFIFNTQTTQRLLFFVVAQFGLPGFEPRACLTVKYLFVAVGGKLVESSSLNYMESDTMWIHPKCAPPPPSHLYINNLYPPEYAELDQARLTGQHDTCYASTDLLEQHYNQVKQTLRWIIVTESHTCYASTDLLEQHYNQVKQTLRWLIVTESHTLR